jgi:hypothetical protein
MKQKAVIKGVVLIERLCHSRSSQTLRRNRQVFAVRPAWL